MSLYDSFGTDFGSFLRQQMAMSMAVQDPRAHMLLGPDNVIVRYPLSRIDVYVVARRVFLDHPDVRIRSWEEEDGSLGLGFRQVVNGEVISMVWRLPVQGRRFESQGSVARELMDRLPQWRALVQRAWLR